LSTANGNSRKMKRARISAKILIRVEYPCYQSFGDTLLSTRENGHIFLPKVWPLGSQFTPYFIQGITIS